MNEEQKKLVEENHNLIYGFLKMCDLNVEEYYDIVAIGLCKAAITYKDDIGAFSTYAYRCMYFELDVEFKKQNRKKRIPTECVFSYYEVMDEEGNCYLELISNDVNVLNEVVGNISKEKYMRVLNKKEKHIAELLSLGYKLKDIADMYGCTCQRIGKIKTDIKHKFTMKGYCL